MVCFIYNDKAFPDDNNSLVFPLNGKSGVLVNISIHLDMDFSKRLDPLFYGSGTLFGANLCYAEKGNVVSQYELVDAIQLFDKRMNINKIRMAAVPKKNVAFGKGTEIIKLFFKIDVPGSACFVLNRFNFGNRFFGHNVVLKAPVIKKITQLMKNYEKISHNHLWMTRETILVSQN